MTQQERCRWTKFSESALATLENKILNVVKTAYKSWFVNIGPVVGKDDKIWTISLNENKENTPLVLLHGFAAGIGFWCLNYDEIAKNRPLYAIDLLGFGRSSRPSFSNDAEKAEQEMVGSLEEWRKRMNLPKMILLGHSFGGYLATSYAINHPDKVKHLILVDPWGFSEKPEKLNLSLKYKALAMVFYPFTYFNPLAAVRAAGPLGPWLVRKMRQDISEKYGTSLEDKEIISEYIYHCNSQNPSGETAFHNMLQGFGWAKNPMVKRFDQIEENIPITFIYGERSWIKKDPGYIMKEQRPGCYVKIEIIPNAGHHIHADQPELFNKVVSEVCHISDNLDLSEMLSNKKTTTTYKEIVVSSIEDEGNDTILITEKNVTENEQN